MIRRMIAAAALLLAVTGGHAAAMTLVSEQEAAMADNPLAAFDVRAATARGPILRQDCPPPPGAVERSPTCFRVSIRPNSADVLLNSLRVTYLKAPPVDITPRVAPYVTPQGIDVPEAELPPGRHAFRIEISDATGNVTVTVVRIERRP